MSSIKIATRYTALTVLTAIVLLFSLVCGSIVIYDNIIAGTLNWIDHIPSLLIICAFFYILLMLCRVNGSVTFTGDKIIYSFGRMQKEIFVKEAECRKTIYFFIIRDNKQKIYLLKNKHNALVVKICKIKGFFDDPDRDKYLTKDFSFPIKVALFKSGEYKKLFRLYFYLVGSFFTATSIFIFLSLITGFHTILGIYAFSLLFFFLFFILLRLNFIHSAVLDKDSIRMRYFYRKKHIVIPRKKILSIENHISYLLFKPCLKVNYLYNRSIRQIFIAQESVDIYLPVLKRMLEKHFQREEKALGDLPHYR